jgi:hypothetical protein
MPATRLKVQEWFADETPRADAFEAAKYLGGWLCSRDLEGLVLDGS